MRRQRLLTLLIVLACGLLAAPPAARAADPFYLELLRDGSHAFDRGDFQVAERDLRLACFGLLDDPKALAACLGRLALAQDKANDVNGFRETFRRLAEVEDRFQGYSQSDLPPELRAALEQRLLAQIPAATLQSSPPVFSALGKKPAAAAPAAQPAKGAKPATAAPPPQTAPTVPAQPAQPPAVQPLAGRAAAETPAPRPSAPAASAAPRPLSDEDKGKLEAARKLLGETGKTRELRQAFDTARAVADAHPEAADAQRLAGEAAYRVSRWQEAVTYLQRGGPLPDSEPELLFYLAVSQWESGDQKGAATTLRRALPNLQRSAYVDTYARKILGQ